MNFAGISIVTRDAQLIDELRVLFCTVYQKKLNSKKVALDGGLSFLFSESPIATLVGEQNSRWPAKSQ